MSNINMWLSDLRSKYARLFYAGRHFNEVGPGWREIVEEFVRELDKISSSKSYSSKKDTIFCSTCECLREKHINANDECGASLSVAYVTPTYYKTYWVPNNFYQRIWLRIRGKVASILDTAFAALFKFRLYSVISPCSCRGFSTVPVQITQIKQKFAQLRIHTTNLSGSTKDLGTKVAILVAEAEKKASVTCEECGREGNLHCKGYSLRVLCPFCAKLNEYVRCNVKLPLQSEMRDKD